MNIKAWWRSRTIWLGALTTALGATVEYLADSKPDLSPYLGHWAGIVAVAIGVANVLLRLRTAAAIAGTKAAR